MNEENIKNSENSEEENNLPETTSEETTEEIIEESREETIAESVIQEEAEAPKDFIDEFAPASIVIPNYDREKELKKAEKINLKREKRNTKKSRRRRRIIKKILNVTCAIVLTVLIFAVAVTVASSVIVRLNTSQFAVESAIKNYGAEKLIVGEIKDHEKLGMNQSAENASMADILRDNATIPVTYAFIEQEVDRSTYPEFVAEIATDVIGYYVFGTPYKQVEREEIENLIYKNSSKIKTVTGQELTESDCTRLAKYISKTSVTRELSVSELSKQDAAEYTPITSVLFSYPVLIGMILALVLVIVLVSTACKGYAYKIIGWSLFASGITCGIGGFLIKPMYTASTAFVQCVADAVTAAFNRNSLVYGIVVAVVGILVLLIGSAMKDRDNDDIYEETEDEEYIEEIEQIADTL